MFSLIYRLLLSPLRLWWNWQTRNLEVVVPILMACRFKSC